MIALFWSILLFLLGRGIYSAVPADFVATRQLAQHEFSLNQRYKNSYVNDVFAQNVLLTINYTAGEKVNPKAIDWNKLKQPSVYKLALEPGEIFAFHEDVLPQYKGKVSKTTNAHFNSNEGFKSDGYLVGDGVCHLASLLYWVAKDAGLAALAPTRHDFAPVPEVPRQYGVSIFYLPGMGYRNKIQNLYITNNKSQEVVFEFKLEGDKLKISAFEILAATQHKEIPGIDVEPIRWASFPLLGNGEDVKKRLGVPPGYLV